MVGAAYCTFTMILVIVGLGNGFARWLLCAKCIIRETNIGKKLILSSNRPNAQYHAHINR
jgi:hypothetical protein